MRKTLIYNKSELEYKNKLKFNIQLKIFNILKINMVNLKYFNFFWMPQNYQ